jgi:hypothetical protein
MELNPMMRQVEQDALVASIQQLSLDAQLLEFGCGGSTLLFARTLRGTQHLHSVEHNLMWCSQVRDELTQQGLSDRVTVHYVSVNALSSGAPEEENIVPGSEGYRSPPVDWSAIRWVLVDGIMRSPILIAMRSRLSPGTPVWLHDYVGRQGWYDKACDLYTRLPIVDTLLPMQATPNIWLPR